jgi:hypothetical protein
LLVNDNAAEAGRMRGDSTVHFTAQYRPFPAVAANAQGPLQSRGCRRDRLKSNDETAVPLFDLFEWSGEDDAAVMNHRQMIRDALDFIQEVR